MAAGPRYSEHENRDETEFCEDWVRKSLDWVQRVADDDRSAVAANEGLPELPSDPFQIVALGIELAEALDRRPLLLGAIQDSESKSSQAIRGRLSLLSRLYSAALQQTCLDATLEDDSALSETIAKVAIDLFRSLHQFRIVEGQGFLLQTLAWPRTASSLERLVQLLIELTPSDWTATALALSPLMRNTQWPVGVVFPALLEGLHQPSMIAPILDLANFCQHQQMVSQHPAAHLADSLTEMLGGVVARLGMLEEDPTKFGDDPQLIQRVLGDAIAICVALCDALGLIGHQAAIGKLHQALALRHRRVQTEAAGALARMDQEIGRDSLVALAAEPVARLRVLQYCDELGLTEKIDEIHTLPSALAEAELALWLAQPQQLGFPPRTIEIVDQRMLYWPSFDEPQSCFLFRYQYTLPQGEWSNIGMAGPLVHSFAADLADLPVSDIYAAFAGWHAEHPEIYEVPAEHWNSAHHRQAAPLMRALEERGHHDVRPLWMGCFLGESCVVAESMVDDAIGVAVTDGLETIWYPRVGRTRPLGPFEAYAIFKGRKMLRTFNPDMSSDLLEET
jgi:hypothetical protein